MTDAAKPRPMEELQKAQRDKEELEKRIQKLREETRETVLQQVKEQCKAYEITATELRGCLSTRRKAAKKKSTRKKS